MQSYIFFSLKNKTYLFLIQNKQVQLNFKKKVTKLLKENSNVHTKKVLSYAR